MFGFITPQILTVAALSFVLVIGAVLVAIAVVSVTTDWPE